MADVDRQYLHMPLYAVIASLTSVMGKYHRREVKRDPLLRKSVQLPSEKRDSLLMAPHSAKMISHGSAVCRSSAEELGVFCVPRFKELSLLSLGCSSLTHSGEALPIFEVLVRFFLAVICVEGDAFGIL